MARRALEPVDFPFFDYRRLTFSLGIVAEPAVFRSLGEKAEEQYDAFLRTEPHLKRMFEGGELRLVLLKRNCLVFPREVWSATAGAPTHLRS